MRHMAAGNGKREKETGAKTAQQTAKEMDTGTIEWRMDMNQVFLSGIIAEKPRLTQPEGGTAHLLFPLRVRHRTAKGVVKHELYTVNAWNNVALWGAKRLEQGQLVAVQGYLTQHMRESGALSVEVTADEFLPANKGSAREQTSPAKRMDGAHENTAVYSPQTEGKSSLPDEEDGFDAASMLEAAS